MVKGVCVVSITFGFPREPKDNRRHLFKGPLDGETRLIDSAVYISLLTGIENGDLTVNTSVSNFGCGHAIPTGEPMRAPQPSGEGIALPHTPPENIIAEEAHTLLHPRFAGLIPKVNFIFLAKPA